MRKKGILNNNHGVSMVIFVLTVTVIIGFAALVVDIGMVMLERQRLKNAIDAASLAAAQELPNQNTAMQTAYEYMSLNGYDESYISLEFVDNNKGINISATKNVDFFFAKVLGFSNANTYINSGAVLQSIGGAFNYVLFSGSTTDSLNLNGSNFYIDGNTHTNGKFRMNGSSQTITGTCEAVSTITTNGNNINIGSRVPNASFVEMPDFSETIKAQAEENGNVYSESKTYNGDRTNLDESVFVNGDLTINGSNFYGQGCILVKDDISFNGDNVTQNRNDAICFYSQNGDIVINGSNAEVHGILYAPNGAITLNGSNQTIYGRVIAKEVRFNGSNSKIIGSCAELASLPTHGVKLTK